MIIKVLQVLLAVGVLAAPAHNPFQTAISLSLEDSLYDYKLPSRFRFHIRTKYICHKALSTVPFPNFVRHHWFDFQALLMQCINRIIDTLHVTRLRQDCKV